ncbi:hemolysin family protein [Dermacoccaceae bacterium W4C1]
MDFVFLGLAVFLLFFNAFFVGAEFALISARRSSIEPAAAQGNSRAVTTLGAMENVSVMMATAQFGITVCSLALGAVGEPALAHLIESPLGLLGIPEGLLHPIAFTISLIIVVGLHVVIGEMVPKNIALAGPDRAALLLGPPLVLISRALHPIVIAMNWLANKILHLFNVEPRDEVASAFTREEVHDMVEESSREGLLDEQERGLLSRALSFESATIADITIPVAEVVNTGRGRPRRELERKAVDSGFSRIAVYDPSVQDRFVGYVHIKDVLTIDDEQWNAAVPDSAVREMPSLRAGAPLREALELMQRSQAHMVQAREADKTVGIVVLEDVVERIVGEIGAEDQAAAQAQGNAGPASGARQ